MPIDQEIHALIFAEWVKGLGTVLVRPLILKTRIDDGTIARAAAVRLPRIPVGEGIGGVRVLPHPLTFDEFICDPQPMIGV